MFDAGVSKKQHETEIIGIVGAVSAVIALCLLALIIYIRWRRGVLARKIVVKEEENYLENNRKLLLCTWLNPIHRKEESRLNLSCGQYNVGSKNSRPNAIPRVLPGCWCNSSDFGPRLLELYPESVKMCLIRRWFFFWSTQVFCRSEKQVQQFRTFDFSKSNTKDAYSFLVWGPEYSNEWIWWEEFIRRGRLW